MSPARAAGVRQGTAQLFFPQTLGSSFGTHCPPYSLWGSTLPSFVFFDAGGEETSM